MINKIELNEEEPPPTLEARIRGAVYAASVYYTVTEIKIGHRMAYIIPANMYKESDATP